MGAIQYGMPNYICQHCQVEFYNKNNTAKFCSQTCAKNNSKKGTYGRCSNCDKDVYVPNHKTTDKVFCSWACHMEAQRKRRPTRTCQHCGMKFKKKARKDAKFCSAKCREQSESNMLHLAQIRRKQARRKTTKLERAGYSILEEIGLEYEPQFVYSRYVADAYIKELNLIMQFDGDYWHGNTARFPNLTERQKKQQEVDNRANKAAEELGYRVLRFWESDIGRVKNCLEELKKTIRISGT